MRRYSGLWRPISLLLSLLLCLGTVAAGTLAFLTAADQKAENDLSMAEVSCRVEEEFPAPFLEKNHVVLRNTGTTDAWLRAAILVTWKAEDGSVSAAVPVPGEDYTMTMGSGWTFLGGYYYYNGAVAPGEATADLIAESTQTSAKEGYVLSVDVTASALQATDAAARDCWLVTFLDGSWKGVS